MLVFYMNIKMTCIHADLRGDVASILNKNEKISVANNYITIVFLFQYKLSSYIILYFLQD